MANHTYHYRIRLTSDAEPGTGLGGEVLNEIVPRDSQGRPTLDGTHIKGLMSQALRDVAVELWHPSILDTLFGKPHVNGLEGASLIRVGAAAAPAETKIHTVTRTAVGDAGTAEDRSLRTTEVVPVGTVYEGVIETSLPPDSPADLAWRLALLSIPAVGGGRNRGCGRCVVELSGKAPEKRTPGQLLMLLHKELAAAENRLIVAPVPQTVGPAPFVHSTTSGQAVTLRLAFAADSPVCCPETTTRTNVIESGFSIPASAVQGMLLTHVGESNRALATELFKSDLFRAWPMQPCEWRPAPGASNVKGAPTGTVASLDKSPYPVSVRVSLTHRTAKFTMGDVESEKSEQSKPAPRLFEDEAIEQYDWTKTVHGSPLKASDGVLLYGQHEGEIALWKAGEMPRVVTAHGVHHGKKSTAHEERHDEHSPGGRNLFTMNAMAPMVWQGLLSVPAEAADPILKYIQANPRVALGKSRSVRGMGRLSAWIEPDVPLEWRLVEHERPKHEERPQQVTLFIVQSPLRIPGDSMQGISAGDALRGLVASWAHTHKLPHDSIETWPNAGVRFGWNRLEGKRLKACYVILPGSVFSLPGGLDPQAVARAIRAGIGDSQDRQRGFGAVVIHPGRATSMVKTGTTPTVGGGDADRRKAVALVLSLAQAQSRLPSTSQIRAVQQRIERAGPVEAIKFLEKQRDERPARIWGAWEAIHQPLVQLIKDHQARPAIIVHALEVLADLTLMATREERR